MKRKYVILGTLLVAIIAATLLGSNMLLSKTSTTNPQPQTSSDTSSSDTSQPPADFSNLNNAVNQVGPKTIQLSSNSSELTVNRGTTVQETIPLNVLKADPIRIFIDDAIFNTTEPTLPEGVSITVNINGHDALIPSSRSISNQPSIADLQTTTLGQNAIQYKVGASKDVPVGTYRIRLAVQSWLSDGTRREYAVTYEVILHVQ